MVGPGSVLRKIIQEIPFQRCFSTNHLRASARGASSVCSGGTSRSTEPPSAALLWKARVIYSLSVT